MQPYAHQHGKSGVEAFECGPDFIRIVFLTSPDVVYVYDHESPGAIHVERMKRYAKEGRGLSTYISQFVREQYHCKEVR